MGNQINLKHYYVSDVDYDLLIKESSRLENEAVEYSKNTIELKKNILKKYMDVFSQI